MPEICAVLSDIDGTILRHGTAAPTPAVQEAIKLLTVPLIPVSIRSYQLLRRQAWAFGATVCIPDGGATIAFAETGEIIWRQWLTAEAVEGIVHRIGRRCVMMSCQEKYRPFTPDETALLSYRSKIGRAHV